MVKILPKLISSTITVVEVGAAFSLAVLAELVLLNRLSLDLEWRRDLVLRAAL